MSFQQNHALFESEYLCVCFLSVRLYFVFCQIRLDIEGHLQLTVWVRNERRSTYQQ